MLNPSAALLFFQAAKEIGDAEWRNEFGRRFVEGVFRRHDPEHFIGRNSDAALASVQLVRELGGEGFLGRDPDFFERLFHPRQLLELSERNPELALAFVQLMREVGGEGFLRRLEPEFFERAFHPRHLLELSERNPEAALAWMQLMRELGSEGFLRRLEPEFFEPAFSSVVLDSLLRRKPAAFAVALRLVRVFELRPAAEAMLTCLTSSLDRPGGSASLLGNLPLSAIDDVRWLAASGDRRGLCAALFSLVGDPAHEKPMDNTLNKGV
jgi:hypothetical protein